MTTRFPRARLVASLGLFAFVVLPALAGAQQPAAPAPQTQKPAGQPAPASPAPAPAPQGAQPQAPVEKPTTPAAKPAASKPAAGPAYSYDPVGRRDPFISLVGRGENPQAGAARPPGLSGLLISEVSIKGVLRDRDGFMVLLRAPDNKTYTVRVGAKLLDGTVKTISQDKVVFSQDVNDPLSLVKQREVPKPVRQGEGRGE